MKVMERNNVEGLGKKTMELSNFRHYISDKNSCLIYKLPGFQKDLDKYY